MFVIRVPIELETAAKHDLVGRTIDTTRYSLGAVGRRFVLTDKMSNTPIVDTLIPAQFKHINSGQEVQVSKLSLVVNRGESTLLIGIPKRQ